MTACNWPVDEARRCRRGGQPFFSDLVLCWQHRQTFLDALRCTVTRPEDRFDEAIRDTAQVALAEIAYAARQERKSARHAASLVYFVVRDGFVKIGYSSAIHQRLKQISSGSSMIEGMTVGPVELLATIEAAGEETERWLHRRFEHLRVGGEWFLLDDELRSFISGLKGCCVSAAA